MGSRRFVLNHHKCTVRICVRKYEKKWENVAIIKEREVNKDRCQGDPGLKLRKSMEEL